MLRQLKVWLVMNESHFLKINGEVFECQCGVNLFHYDANPPTGCEWHICNGCGTTYESEVEL
jgi:hypothetical protein